ncbi:MAG: nuclear transport factor 2 family protein [Streptosporangiaceae bacterium]
MDGRSDDLIAAAGRYLQLCERRQLAEAGRYLAPGAELVFPGGVHLSSLEAVAANASGRYRLVRKRPESSVAGRRVSDGRAVVVSTGTLDGETLRGSPFSGVRYADIFVFDDGLILEQHVYNDLGELGHIEAGPR